MPRSTSPTFNRTKWTTAKRSAYFKAHSENFAGPAGSYPIEDASDVGDAWDLAGHADNPDAVRSKIIDIAKRLNLDSALPETAKAGSTAAERAAQPDDGSADGRDAETLDDDETGVNDPNGDDMPDEEDGDPDLKPTAASDARNVQGSTFMRNAENADVLYFAPITRIDREKREVIGTATAEVKDSYNTVIGYDASKDALNRWRGNIREMHDPAKAVGRALEVTPDDAGKRVIVRAKISRGAEDTWQKVLDGTLTGFSIGGRNGKWTERVIDGEKLPYLERYDAVELSLVDNPACPVANIEVVRADGIASAVLAKDDEITAPQVKNARANVSPPTLVERKGAKISAETRDALHSARDHALASAKQSAETCGCNECMEKANQIAEHDDGDGDMDAPAMRRAIAEIVRAEIATSLRDAVAPTMSRVNALLASDASRSEAPDLTRRVDDLSEQLSAIHALVQKIADQPTDGGPVLHGAPVDKRLATQGHDPRRGVDDADVMRRAVEMGFAPPTDPQEQIRAAAKLIRPIPR